MVFCEINNAFASRPGSQFCKSLPIVKVGSAKGS